MLPRAVRVRAPRAARAATGGGVGTRDRIVAAAGEVFAEQGFRAATIRQITERAGVNLAAVNYHFQDKAELYAQVLQQAHAAAVHVGQFTAADDAAAEPGGGLDPEARLRRFVGTFLHYLLDPARPGWHLRVRARELAEPTPALDRLVDEAIRPMSAALCDVVQALVGPELPRGALLLLAQSVLGQCLFYSQCGAVIKRVHPEFRVDRPADIGRLADHITDFSLPAIRAAATGPRRN